MNEISQILREEIQLHGAMRFDRFMHLALYCPLYGYYEGERDNLGKAGDFYTSVCVGPLFGQLLAAQFADWIADLALVEAGAVGLVEAGAHRGDLARDILGWLRQWRPKVYEDVQYWIIEPSNHRQELQRAALGEFGEKVEWASHFLDMRHPVRGIVFANELLDAMPIRRFGWDAKAGDWFEWGVLVEHSRFCWTRLPGPAPAPRGFTPELGAALPDGYTVESSPAAIEWWRSAAESLEVGKLLTIDYGHLDDPPFTPERTQGTLRAYHHHHVSSDVLSHPGEQDLTAHVEWPAIIEAGEAAGLKTERFLGQAEFLTGIAAELWEGRWTGPEWSPALRRQFKALTHPDHFGRAFRVLIQSKGG